MKKLFVPTLLIVIVGILFSSCSNTSKMAFAKRHYRNGYYVNFAGKSPTAVAANYSKVPAIIKHQTSPIAIAKPESYVTVKTPVSISEKSVVVEKIATPIKVKENNLISTNSTIASEKPLTLNTQANNDMSGSVGDGHHDRDNSSVPFVVIVLCAIFIPPLGVGLMYGINSYFWIDLILTLLFFFPGMIFALIVVLM